VLIDSEVKSGGRPLVLVDLVLRHRGALNEIGLVDRDNDRGVLARLLEDPHPTFHVLE
jgi:hypothetical protein